MFIINGTIIIFYKNAQNAQKTCKNARLTLLNKFTKQICNDYQFNCTKCTEFLYKYIYSFKLCSKYIAITKKKLASMWVKFF